MDGQSPEILVGHRVEEAEDVVGGRIPVIGGWLGAPDRVPAVSRIAARRKPPLDTAGLVDLGAGGEHVDGEPVGQPLAVEVEQQCLGLRRIGVEEGREFLASGRSATVGDDVALLRPEAAARVADRRTSRVAEVDNHRHYSVSSGIDVFALNSRSEADGEYVWRALGRQRAEPYLAGRPFPHLVEQDFLPRELVLAAEQEELPRALTLPVHRGHREHKAESRAVAGPAAERLLAMMMSPAFVAFVEEATGLRNLESDDSNYWAGLHASGRGAFSSLHRDFAVHPVTRKWHRVNALLFLNSDWREEYGGDLELWSSDLVACGARIKPDAGTLVIFETNDATLHGIPDPIACPKGRMRLSLAVYYYSDEPWPESPHEFRFRRARRPQDPWWIGVPDLAEVASIVLDPLTGRIPVVRRFMNALRSRRS